MAERALRLHPADSELSYVESLLDRNGLPNRDVRSKPECFFYATDSGERVGVGGIERFGRTGLLRSVVVESSKRREGYGTALCAALESRAARAGVETLYLLTTTASGFFAGRNYVEVERDEAPAAIRQTTEFDTLCPATALCMRKSLSRHSG